MASATGKGQVIDTVSIDVLLKTDGFKNAVQGVTSGLQKIEQEVKTKADPAIEKFGHTATNTLKQIASSVFQVGSAFVLFQKWLSHGDELERLSDRLDTSARSIDLWGKALESVGGSAGSFRGTLKGLKSSIEQFRTFGTGNGNMMAALGVKLTDNGKARDTVEVFKDLIKATDKFGQARQQHILKQLGFDQDTLFVLKKHREEFLEAAKAKERLAYTDQEAKAAREFNRTISNTRNILSRIVDTLWAKLAPVLTTVIREANKFIDVFLDHQDVVLGFVLAMTVAFGGPLVKAIKAATAAVFAFAKNPALLAISALVLTIDDLWHFLNGDKSVTGDILSTMGWSEEEIEKARKAITDLGVYIAKIILWVAELVKNPKQAWLDFCESAKAFGTDLWDSIKTKCGEAVDYMKQKWSEFATWFKDLPVIKQIISLIDKMDKFGNKFIGVDKKDQRKSQIAAGNETEDAEDPMAAEFRRALEEQLKANPAQVAPQSARTGAGGDSKTDVRNEIKVTQNFNAPIDPKAVADLETQAIAATKDTYRMSDYMAFGTSGVTP